MSSHPQSNDDTKSKETSLDKTAASHSAGKRSKVRLWCFRLISIFVIPVLLFGGIELGLRAFRDQTPLTFLVPLDSDPKLSVDNYKSMWQFFPKALARTPQPIATPTAKPDGTKRIIVFGGSAAMGDPEPAYGLPRTIDALLSARFPNEKFEVINAAITAVNSHVVRSVAADCRPLNADAWVVYMGNNEVHGPFGAGTVFGGNDTPLRLIRFGLAFKRSATGQFLASVRSGKNSPSTLKSWGGMKMFLDHQIRHDDPELERVYSNYQANLNAIIRMAARNQVPMVLSTMVTNLGECAPFISLHSEGLSTAQLGEWQSNYDRAIQMQANGEFGTAIDAFQKAAEIDANFAELQYRLAECFRATDRIAEASRCYEKARDLDCLRFRADSRINQIIRTAAEEHEAEVTFVDSEKELASECVDGILGEEVLFEHVHFNFHGNYELALRLAVQVANVLNLSGDDGVWISEDACGRRLGLTDYHRHLTLLEMQSRLRAAPFDSQSNAATRQAKLQQATSELKANLTKAAADREIEHYQKLLADRPNDWVLKKQFSLLLESVGRLPETIDLWRSITEQLPHYAEGHYQLGVFLNRAKEWKEAEQPLRRTLELRPEFARASNSLGICLSHLGKIDESYEQFAKAVSVQPSFAEAFVNWGLVLANQKQPEAAIQKYKEAIDADANHLAAHIHLANHYRSKQDYPSLRDHYQAISRIRPRDVAAQINYGMVLLKLKHTGDAKLQFEKVLKLDPNNSIARQAMQSLGGS